MEIKHTIAVQPGDWVRIPRLFPGFWRVYRVLAGFKENVWSLAEPMETSPRVLVFCHRLVNDSWKRSFSHQSCELSFLAAPKPSEQKRLDKLLASDVGLQKAFERYQIKQNKLDLVTNIWFGGFTKAEAADFSKLCDKMFACQIGNGLTLKEILRVLQDYGLDENREKFPWLIGIQFLCINHELREGEFAFRKYRVLPS
jgi:hypothetical protein